MKRRNLGYIVNRKPAVLYKSDDIHRSVEGAIKQKLQQSDDVRRPAERAKSQCNIRTAGRYKKLYLHQKLKT